jgi:hypothetical protein
VSAFPATENLKALKRAKERSRQQQIKMDLKSLPTPGIV